MGSVPTRQQLMDTLNCNAWHWSSKSKLVSRPADVHCTAHLTNLVLPPAVPDTLKERILLWKFHHYDRNGDNVLFPAEEFIFQLELYEFVRCKAFFDHVSDLVDEDNDGQITHREWTNFFLDGEQRISSSDIPVHRWGTREQNLIDVVENYVTDQL